MRRFLFLLFFYITPVKADEPIQAVIVTTVTESCLNPCVTGIGTFTAYNDVTLKSGIAGRIENVHFQDGDYAKPNQKLFTIYNKEQEAKVKKAAASLAMSKNTLRRKSELGRRGFASPQDLEQAETQVQSDEAEFALAKEALAKTEIYAPFDGALSNRQVSKGAYVIEGDELVRIQDLTPIRLTFQVPQKEIPNIKIGDEVTVTTDVYADKTFQGKVEAIDLSVNEESRSVVVYAAFSNDEGLLIPGLYGRVQLKTSLISPPAVVIPEQAIVVRPDGPYVYKNIGGKAVLTKITVGTRTLDQAQVLSGLQKGNVIVLEGQDKIHDGTPIVATRKKSN